MREIGRRGSGREIENMEVGEGEGEGGEQK